MKLRKSSSVFCCEICPSAALKLKMLTQCTNVHFRRFFIFALLTNKFFGENAGLIQKNILIC